MTSSFSQCEFLYIGVMVISIKIKAFHPISLCFMAITKASKSAYFAKKKKKAILLKIVVSR